MKRRKSKSKQEPEITTYRDHPRQSELEEGRRQPGYMSPAELADYEERHSGPVPKQLRAAYYPIIGDAPKLGPDDRAGAAAYLKKISIAIARGGWTRSEATRLRAMHLKWYNRANGLDPYFAIYGNRRQWAGHGKTYKDAEDKKVMDGAKGIREIIRREAINQKRLVGKDLTPEDRARRLEEIDKARNGNGSMDAGMGTQGLWDEEGED